ncbi:hypothetical protein BN1723_000623 [Verticillium longisporum]|uniref:Uncharacterized protein n=1 Tax=Verticillium longisporum TaxID=100787 RepID=A0A0G4MXZ9_VERLO|nr:hypothetical protein BN1723_000623 [Verticillium longisporum]
MKPVDYSLYLVTDSTPGILGTADLVSVIAAERAAVRDDVKGPGSFVPAFLDELARVRQMTVDGDLAWLAAAKVSLVDEA